MSYAGSGEKLQELVSKLDEKYRRMGLKIKNEAMGVTKASGRLPVNIRIAAIKQVSTFR